MNIFTKTCPICVEKNNTISALQAQISMLEKLLFPKKSQYTQDLEVEANALLNGQEEPIQLVDDAVAREASLLLSGDYEESYE